MNKNIVEKLLIRIKTDIAALEAELSKQMSVEERKPGKNETYHIIFNNQTIGGAKGLSKRAVFKTIVSTEASSKSILQLNSLFDRKHFPKLGNFHNFDYVIDEATYNSLEKKIQKMYLPLDKKSADKKSIYVLGEWAEFHDKEKQTPGNFPILTKLSKKLGYKIVALQK